MVSDSFGKSHLLSLYQAKSANGLSATHKASAGYSAVLARRSRSLTQGTATGVVMMRIPLKAVAMKTRRCSNSILTWGRVLSW